MWLAWPGGLLREQGAAALRRQARGPGRRCGLARVGDPDQDVRALALEGISAVVRRGDHDTGARGALTRCLHGVVMAREAGRRSLFAGLSSTAVWHWQLVARADF